MKPNAVVTTSSLVTLLFLTFHMADDVARQMEAGDLSTFGIVVPFVTLWLYGTLLLPGRRSGYVILILVSLMGLVVPVVHMQGAGISAAVAQSSGGFFFVWTLLMLAAGSVFNLVLSARGLWELRRGAPPR